MVESGDNLQLMMNASVRNAWLNSITGYDFDWQMQVEKRQKHSCQITNVCAIHTDCSKCRLRAGTTVMHFSSNADTNIPLPHSHFALLPWRCLEQKFHWQMQILFCCYQKIQKIPKSDQGFTGLGFVYLVCHPASNKVVSHKLVRELQGSFGSQSLKKINTAIFLLVWVLTVWHNSDKMSNRNLRPDVGPPAKRKRPSRCLQPFPGFYSHSKRKELDIRPLPRVGQKKCPYLARKGAEWRLQVVLQMQTSHCQRWCTT